MGFHHLDQFARVDSALTRRSPAVRLLTTLVLALGAALLPLGAWPQLAALGLLVLALAAVARIPARAFLARFLPPFAFVLLASVAVLVLAPGDVVATIGPIRVTDAGALRFGSVAGRAAVALGAAVVLVSTTTFPELVRALRTLRLPDVVTSTLGLAYRFLYIGVDEMQRLRRAAASRNAAAGSVPRRRLFVGMAAASLRRSLNRSERVHRSMVSRGYRGSLPALGEAVSAGRPVVELGALAVLVTLIVGSAQL